MSFFTDDVLINFNKHINGDTYLDQNQQNFLQKNKLALLNKDGVMDWLLRTRSIGSTSLPRKANQTTTTPSDFSLTQVTGFVNRLTEEQCKNQIGYGYGKNSVINSISMDKHDILLVVTDTHKNVPQSEYTPEQYITFKMKQVKGFMIVEKGECKKYLNRYSVRLICSKASQGTLLMGMYLYTLLTTQTGDNQTGILELAGGYKNTPGLCTYTKFGFSQDDDLNGVNCFGDFNNLPMSVKLHGSNVTEDDIIQVILREKTKLDIYDPNDTELCTTYKPDDPFQKRLQIKLANLIEDKRRDEFLPNESKSNLVILDEDIKFTKGWIISEKNKKKGTVTNTEFVQAKSAGGEKQQSVSGGKQTNRKRKGCKRTTRKRKSCKRTTRKK
jgi:hypothetical protein